MIFSSFPFLLLFLPITLIGYFSLSKCKNANIQRVFLILASLVFYSVNNPKYLLLILSSILVNYALARYLQRAEGHRKALLFVGVLFNLALLGYYKYFNFFIENVSALTGVEFALRQIALPLGISFFTFQQLSFLISIYRKEEFVDTFLSYCLFVTFFPQLVAGPIVLYDELVPQFRDESLRKFDPNKFAAAVYIFVIGMFKKAVIADTFAIFVNNSFGGENLGWLTAWCVSLSYTLQIYFDFSGYSDMAVGLAGMFNFQIPFNFLSPYKSESIREFWKRWHITLGRALRTYIYIPLGGNKKGLLRTCINLFLTFLVSGLWHGAAWTFVAWGALHGLLAVTERLLERWLVKIPKAIRIAVTFVEVNLLWVLFRAESFAQALVQYRNMFDFRSMGADNLANMATNGVINYPATVDMAYVLTFLATALCVVFACKNSRDKLAQFRPTRKTALFVTLLLCFVIVCLTRQSVFIYFNF